MRTNGIDDTDKWYRKYVLMRTISIYKRLLKN